MTVAAAHPLLPAVLPDLVRQHAENAAQFWAVWMAAFQSDGAAHPEALRWRGRMEAHLDGAVLAGAVGRDIALQIAEAFPAAAEVFVAARLALRAGDSPGTAQIFALTARWPQTAAGLRSAVATVPADLLSSQVRRWLNAPDWPARMAGLAACAAHGADPGSHLEQLLVDPAPAVRAEAARLAAALRRPDTEALLGGLLTDPVPEVQFAAARALAPLPASRARAAAAMRSLATHSDLDPELAGEIRDLAVIASDAAALQQWIPQLWNNPETTSLAIRAVGINGDRSSWPWLIGCMEASETALPATWAAADMLRVEPREGALFTMDPDRLGRALSSLADAEGLALACPAAFAEIIAMGAIPAPETDLDAMPQRARRMQRLRSEIVGRHGI